MNTKTVLSTELEQRIRVALEEIDRFGLRRVLHSPSGVDLSSNDYLGLTSHPVLKQRMAEAICLDGCGSTGSRLLRGHRESFTALERRFAQFKGTQSSIYFSSGYLANLAVLSTFPQSADTIFSDQLNHASLIDGARLSHARRVIFPHNDVEALRRLIAGSPTAGGQKFIVTESLFSMDGDFAPLAEYAALCRETGAALIVDEAHACGIYGARGSGWIEEAGVGDDVFLSVNTAGKALGVSGAFVAGPEWAIEFLIQRARQFIFSTAPPPSIAAAIGAALDIVESEPQRRARVRDLARHLRSRLGLPGDSQIIPVILGSNERAVSVASSLQAHGFDARAVRPPSVPEGAARLRLSVNVNLSEEILDRFVDCLCAASS